MTAIPESRPQGPPRRRRRVLLSALLLGAILAGVGAAVYFVRFHNPPPEPPDAPNNENDPAVAVAVRLARERVLKEPRSGAAWGELGEVFLANELEAEANVCFTQAERFDPNNPRWPYFLGGPSLNQGDRAGALPYFQRAADLADAAGDANDSPRLLLAETLLALGRLDEAEAQYRRVLARHPDDLRAHYGMGLLAVARDDWEGSRDHFRRCLGSPEAQRKACVQLAAVSQRLGDTAEADKFREQADRLPKDFDWNDPYAIEYLKWGVKKRARYKLAEAQENADHYAEAVAILQPMAEDYPDDYLVQLTLAKNLGRMGDYGRAERAMRRALELAPDSSQVQYYHSLLLMRKGQQLQKAGASAQAEASYKEAVKAARAALAIKPDHGYAFMSLGLSYKYLGQRAEALAALREAVQCNPELPELHYYLGDQLAETGERAEARHHLELALEFGPPQATWRRAAQERLDALKKEASGKGGG
jgi:tetratricopeptide (TPR) repeat protein